MIDPEYAAHLEAVSKKLQDMMPKGGELIMKIDSSSFTLLPDDGPKTIIYRALASVENDNWVFGETILDALKDAPYSRATLNQALSKLYGVVEKRSYRHPETNVKLFSYRLIKGGKVPTDKKRVKTVKERQSGK